MQAVLKVGCPVETAKPLELKSVGVQPESAPMSKLK
jgi:hypothetical protein